MGLILDTSILIQSERQGEGVGTLLRRTREKHGEVDIALSSITIIELTHGIYRAKLDKDRIRRRTFGVVRDLLVIPLSVEIAQLAGQIEGEQAAKGISIAVQDLVIGATALHVGFDVATLNVRHFQMIPGLKVVSP